jgi:hypothetical protein
MTGMMEFARLYDSQNKHPSMSTAAIPFWFAMVSPLIGLIAGFLGAWLFS